MYDALFNPIQLAGVTVPNRVARSAHLLSLSLDDLISYTRVRAAGGVGLSVIGAAGVHSTSARLPVVAATDAIIPWYEQLVEACSPYDMRLFQQINHFGAAMPSAPGIQNWSTGPTPNPTVNIVPRTLTKDMIDEIVGSYGQAAGRVKRGGMHGVELNGAHGYLIAQFLSTALNFRDDEYGGSLENRMRFVHEVIDAVRAEVGPEYPLGLRLVADDVLPGGLGPDAYAEIAKLLQHKVDYISVSLGTYWKFAKIFSTMESPLGYEMPTSEVVTRALDIPTMVTGRIMTLDHANHIVESGAADMVSMVRATIADPEIVNKSRAGNAHRVRPCTGTSIGCTGGSATGNFGCVVNATAGQESRMSLEPEAAVVKKKVLIVGGGPAGLEAARTLALRGHEVELHDMRKELGGQASMVAGVRARADLTSITQWLEAEIKELGVTIKLNSFVDPDMLVDSGFDEIILATGGTADTSVPQTMVPGVSIPGSDLPHVFTAWDVLGYGGRANIGKNVVVFDDTGNFEAITAVLKLVDEGAKITLVSRTDMPGARVPFPAVTTAVSREIMLAGDVELVPASQMVKITPDSVTVRWVDVDKERVIPADTVILVNWHHPNRELSEILHNEGIAHHTIGDVNGSQDMQRAIKEAALVARAI